MFKQGSIKNNRGQGTIEYILILIITVAILIGLGSQFYKPFGRFLENYMGEYLQCLLETGELPALGVEDPNLECAEILLAAGEVFSGSGNNNGRGSNRNGDQAGQNKEGSDSGSGGGSGGAGGSRRSGRFLNTPSSASGVGESTAQDSKKKEIPYTGSDSVSSRSRSMEAYRAQGRRLRSIPIRGILYAQQAQQEKEQNRLRQVGSAEEFGVDNNKKKMRVKSNERKLVTLEEVVDWSFGRLFRIGLIIIILLAIILFMASQALQISKNWE